MATINGTAVNFGFTGTNGITISGLSGVLLQSVERSKQADCEVVRNAVGDEVMHGWYNVHDEATLEWIVTGTSLAAAVTNTTLQTPGTIVSITACASDPDLVATSWEVQSGVKVSGSNTNAKRISLPIKKFTNITAQAT